MKILITGANGMLGQDLTEILTLANHEIVSTNRNNLDITNENIVKNFISSDIDLVIHSAAYTNVDKAEEEPEKAFLINAKGTENIAKYTGQLGIPMIYISTDYVFDGTKNTPYLPTDKTCSINVYGESKLKGEEAVMEFNSKYYIARTSWLYGHKGKNFVETMIDLATKNNDLKVVDDQVGCPTWTKALANGLLELINNNFPYGIYHVCGSGSTSWHGFAKKIFEYMNIDINVIPVTSKMFVRPAKRPNYSIMENNKICPNWQDSLLEYIQTRK